MPGLMRGMARTAAVVGTATATRNAVNRRQADKNAQAYAGAMNTAYAQGSPPPSAQWYYAPPQDQNYQALPEQYFAPPPAQYYPPPPAAAPAPEQDIITQLERLGALKAQGLLTEQEFAAAKQRLLAG
jgi:hypothetical protein